MTIEKIVNAEELLSSLKQMRYHNDIDTKDSKAIRKYLVSVYGLTKSQANAIIKRFNRG